MAPKINPTLAAYLALSQSARTPIKPAASAAISDALSALDSIAQPFSPEPNVRTRIALSYEVRGLSLAPLCEPSGGKVGPPVYNERLEVCGWTMPAPADLQ